MDKTPAWLYEDDNNHKDKIAKHERQRLTLGVSSIDMWNLNNHIAQVIVNGLSLMKEEGISFPGNFKDIKAWHKVLDKIIYGYQLHLDDKLDGMVEDESSVLGWRLDTELQEKNMKAFKSSQRLFTKYFLTLWD